VPLTLGCLRMSHAATVRTCSSNDGDSIIQYSPRPLNTYCMLSSGCEGRPNSSLNQHTTRIHHTRVITLTFQFTHKQLTLNVATYTFCYSTPTYSYIYVKLTRAGKTNVIQYTTPTSTGAAAAAGAVGQATEGHHPCKNLLQQSLKVLPWMPSRDPG